jgi:hypothetical protein
MANAKGMSIVESIEFIESSDKFIINVADGSKLPWWSAKQMDNWLSRNQLTGFLPNQAMLNSIVSWDVISVKAGDPVLNFKGEHAKDELGNPRFYDKDVVFNSNLVIQPSEELMRMRLKLAAKAATKEQSFKKASPLERAKAALAAKQAAIVAAKAPTEGSKENPQLEPEELTPEQQLAMSALAMEHEPAGVV